ncbi:hypothetical protein QR680_007104 [Steinernema hermaphroditum]|uniref:BPTI/Kunitz inhibitor domain-containing protein n=1 Tax=Steinernema hermaphroditum TaxID=289476 RepID=A0AA39LYJ1_9BILA|nr:hypothetical protein QR680_007104 [Steinernema hermaphroditum]
MIFGVACVILALPLAVTQKDIWSSGPEPNSNYPIYNCDQKKDSGYGYGLSQKYYYDNVYGWCFAFKYYGQGGNGNRFDSFDRCMSSCRPADGYKMCGPVDPLNLPYSCNEVEGRPCPHGYTCKNSPVGHNQCCSSYYLWIEKHGRSSRCKDGSQAVLPEEQPWNPYITPKLAKSCNDLICGRNARCEQTSKVYAKCCKM